MLTSQQQEYSNRELTHLLSDVMQLLIDREIPTKISNRLVVAMADPVAFNLKIKKKLDTDKSTD